MERKTLGLGLLILGIVSLALLAFVKSDMDSRGAFLCELVANDPDTEMTQCPAHQSSADWMILFLFGVAFVIATVGGYLFFIPGATLSSSTSTAKKVNLSKLSADEKKVYNLLKENDNSMYQSDLIKETGFSKVKISRVLDKLSAKGLIDRKRRGMTNIVVLK